MTIDVVRLPDDVERGATGGPGFRTSIVSLVSGQEQRNSNWAVARGRYNVGYGIQKRTDMQAVIDFFYGRRGRARAFLFKDWSDYKTADAGVAVAAVTGNVLKRQLVMRYDTGTNEYVRKITRPVLSTLKVYIDNVLTTAYTESLGELTFSGDPGGNVKATFEFDVPCRFDMDQLDITLAHFDAGAIPNIPIIEVRE